MKDPSTGRRVARPNDGKQWEEVDVPELRMIDDPLWAAVRERQTALQFEVRQTEDGLKLNRAHRRKFLLSQHSPDGPPTGPSETQPTRRPTAFATAKVPGRRPRPAPPVSDCRPAGDSAGSSDK
jgi:hypothetical protein